MQNITVSNEIIALVNQIFEIEEKLKTIEQENSIKRNIRNMKEYLEEKLFQDLEITFHNPINETYNETRTDCDMLENLSKSFDNLVITQVIRPIIRVKQNNVMRIVQRAKVVVQDKNTIEIAKPQAKLAQTKQKPQPQSSVEKQKQLKEFIQNQLQLNCSNSDVEKLLQKLTKKAK